MRSCSQRALRIALVLLTVGSLNGCGLWNKLFDGERKAKKKDESKSNTEETAKKVEGPSHRVAGEIVSVHTSEGFVLFRLFSQGGGFGNGDLLASLSPSGATSSLKVSGERLGRLYAADIQEGTPSKGDLVTVRRLPESAKPASTPLPEAPESGPGALWLKNIPPTGL